MSFSRWQKLIAASIENAVVAALSEPRWSGVHGAGRVATRPASLADARRPRTAPSRPAARAATGGGLSAGRATVRVPELQVATLARGVDRAAGVRDAFDVLGVDRTHGLHRGLVQHVRVCDPGGALALRASRRSSRARARNPDSPTWSPGAPRGGPARSSKLVASASATAVPRSFAHSSSFCGLFSIVPFSVTSIATASRTTL